VSATATWTGMIAFNLDGHDRLRMVAIPVQPFAAIEGRTVRL
jgi:hypothetical protein